MDNNILIIGSSYNDIGLGTENDRAIFELIDELIEIGYNIILLDNNTYSYSLDRKDIITLKQEINVINILEILEKNNIKHIIPIFGGSKTIKIVNDVLKKNKNISILGISKELIESVNNYKKIYKKLNKINVNTIRSIIVSSTNEALIKINEFDFPVVIKPVNTIKKDIRIKIENINGLIKYSNDILKMSSTNQMYIEQSIIGYKEVSLVIIRDKNNTNLVIGGSEDMDSVGIHTGDSITITPIQTLNDTIYQNIRQIAFQIADELKIIGIINIKFAINKENDNYVIMKLTPYYSKMSALIQTATGYPLIKVITGIIFNKEINKIDKLNEDSNYIAITEPTLDHIVVELPIFPFSQLKQLGIELSEKLDVSQKSVGSSIGIGRSLEEAFEKAIRASHFSNRMFYPTLMNELNDDDVDEQLIHPTNNRLLLLIEALKRGYTVDELSELTKIDVFYFYKLLNLIKIETELINNINDINTLKKAKYYGFSDGFIAHLWNCNYKEIITIRYNNNIFPTYKLLESSAGEFNTKSKQYYATFETENESIQLSENSALIIGSGAFRIGDGSASSNVITSIISGLKNNNIKTIIMNNDPYSLTSITELADKIYFEPLEISDILNVIKIEKPNTIFITGNRIKLIKELKKLDIDIKIIIKDKYLPQTINNIVFNYFYDGYKYYLIFISKHTKTKIIVKKEYLDKYEHDVKNKVELIGFYQVYVQDDQEIIRPMIFTNINLMKKLTNILWIDILIKFMLGIQSANDYYTLENIKQQKWAMDNVELIFNELTINKKLDNNLFALGSKILKKEQ